MRSRLLIAATALAAVPVLGWAAPALAGEEPTDEAPAETPAEEEGPELTHENEECIHLLEEGKDVDDCQEAPSLIAPAVNEIVWGGISFAILFILLAKVAWPGIKKGMEGRTERIRSDLESAETAKSEASTVLDEYRAQLADAKSEAGRIIEEARQTADALKRDHESKLQSELAEMRQKALDDIEAAKSQVMADLRGEVANLAIGAAEIVVQKSLDRQTQVELIEQYINQVGQRA